MISLRCTVLDADRPQRRVDVDVVAPAGAAASDLADALVEEGLIAADRQLSVSGVAVPPSARLGRRPLVSGVLVVSVRHPEPSARQPRGVLELHVVSGPDCGRALPLGPGTVTVGRSPDATMPLADSDLSREHLLLTLDGDGLLLTDLGSSNGTTIDGVPLAGGGQRVLPGQRIRVGSSTLVVRSASERPAATRPTEDGAVAVSRGPRTVSFAEPVTVSRPAAPLTIAAAKMPWVVVLVPLLASVPLAWLTGQPTYLLFGLLSPLTMAATYVSERRGRRRDERLQHATWQAADDDAGHLIDRHLAEDLDRRRLVAGDAPELLATAQGPGHRLWERGPGDGDCLEVVVGHGEQESTVTVASPVSPHEPVRPVLAEAPVVVDLGRLRHLGLCGDTDRVHAAVRLILTRLCVRTSPRALHVVALSGPAWDWTHWLPHRREVSLAGLARLVRERHAAQATAPNGCAAGRASGRPFVLAVLDDVHRWAEDPSLAAVLDDGPGVGVHVLCLAPSQADLPSACGATVGVPGRGVAALTGSGTPSLAIELDGVGPSWAEDVARALAPLRDATADPGGLPDLVTLQEVSAVDPMSSAAIAAAWADQPRSTSAAIGASTQGPLHVDLVRDGPHALVAGTTGAGKSELLQTLVTSLALGNRPDELAFVLVDYKGGAAFRELSDLPHVVGLVTDLDEHLAERALASLQAELTRRERLLAAVGATDIAQYQASADHSGRLARLVLVVDEFRLLATELPQFLDGLVRLAAVGRSLGVHLVLATQRPAGVVSADIKANVNLRICLRVRDRAESDDVLDAPDAAALPLDSPGRALLRTGADALASFQVALAGGRPAQGEPDGVQVRPVQARGPRPGPRSDVDDVVRAVAAAAKSCGAVPPPSPWLPALPDQVGWDDLPPVHPQGVALGLVDLPDAGARDVLGWDPVRSSHLLISGTARTGRTTALLTLALALAQTYPPHVLHLHVIETGDTLRRQLAGLPHLGSAVSSSTPHAVARLVHRLSLPEALGASTVLLIDGWEAVVEALDRVDHGQRTDELLALLRDGEGRGLRAVVAGGRAALTSRLSALTSERLLLRCADPTDLLLAGAPSSTPLSHQPPGRVVHVPSGHEAQLVWPGDSEQIRRRVVQLQAIHPTLEHGVGPLRLRELPRSAELSTARRDGLLVEVGVGGDSAEPMAFDLGAHPLVAVVGPGGSGRSTVLRSLAWQLHRRGHRVLGVSRAQSPLAQGNWDVLRPHEVPDPSHALSDAQIVLVDDLDLLPPHWREVLASWDAGAPAGHGPRSLVVATTTDHLCGSFTGVSAAVRRHRTGVLLHPSRPSDGEPFGVRPQQSDGDPPGRGLLVVRGQATPLQVARPPSPTRAPGPDARAPAASG